MEKKYILDVTKRSSRPRSGRLRELGGAVVAGGGSTVVNVTSASVPDNVLGHTHDNKSSLDKISVDEESYIYVDQLRENEDGTEYSTQTEKVKAGYADEAAHAEEADHAKAADDSDKWDGKHFVDYLDQPVRKSDTVEYAEVITDSLRSAVQFVDGLLGSGYRLWLDEDGKANLTIDKLNVRQTMTVLELLIEKVRSVGGQICVSAANGKIKEVEEDGNSYHIIFETENTFTDNDLMRCQTFTNGQIKSYWVEVYGTGPEGVYVDKSEFEGQSLPEVGDECVLMGNTTDKQRQNLILISATEDGQPRVDVYDGVSVTNFQDCLCARLGNLDGIKDGWFPSDNQPRGNGLYSDNAFLRGTFLLVTGEDVKTRFEITEGMIRSAVEGVRQDFTANKGFLNNPTFYDGLSKWVTENETVFFLAGNKWIWANRNVLTHKGDSATVCTDEGRNVVRIRNKYIRQLNANLRNLPTFETNSDGEQEAALVYLSFFYRCAEAGTLKVEFENVDKVGFADFDSMMVEESIDVTDGYQQYTCSGLWNGTGDFKLSFTGDIYLYMLVLSTDKIDSLTHKYRALFEQSERLVKISAAVFDKDDALLKETGLVVRPEGAGLYAQDGDGNIGLIGVSVEETGEDGTTNTVIKLTADNIKLEGLITANGYFKVLDDGSIEANRGIFNDVTIKGSLSNPFALWDETKNVFDGDNGVGRKDNVVVPITTDSGPKELDAGSFTWSADNSGRVIRVVNYKWGTNVATGHVIQYAPEGKYFYENGKAHTQIKISRECVVLLGYGTSDELYGWIVLARVDVLTEGDYGFPLKVLYQGIFNPNSQYLIDKIWSSDMATTGITEDWGVQQLDTGKYRVYIPKLLASGTWHVMLTGSLFGNKTAITNDSGGQVYACLVAKGEGDLNGKTLSYFDVHTADDNSVNSGGFLFQVIGTNDWVEPTPTTRTGENNDKVRIHLIE